LSSASATKAASLLACTSFTTPGESRAAAGKEAKASPEVVFDRFLLAVLSPVAHWVLTRRLKSERPVTETALTSAEE
jgi:hypothetical protein